MKRQVYYPPCRHLDPNNRDAAGHFFCEHRWRYVIAKATVYTKMIWKGNGNHPVPSGFDVSRCASDCWHCRGTTRRATF